MTVITNLITKLRLENDDAETSLKIIKKRIRTLRIEERRLIRARGTVNVHGDSKNKDSMARTLTKHIADVTWALEDAERRKQGLETIITENQKIIKAIKHID